MDSRESGRSSRMDRYIQEHCSVQQKEQYKCDICSSISEKIQNITPYIWSELLCLFERLQNFIFFVLSQFQSESKEQEQIDVQRPSRFQLINHYEEPKASKPEQLLREQILRNKSQPRLQKIRSPVNILQTSFCGPKMHAQHINNNYSFQDDQSTRDNEASLEQNLSFSQSHFYKEDHEMVIEESVSSQPIFNDSPEQCKMCIDEPMTTFESQKPILKPIYRPIKVIKQQFREQEVQTKAPIRWQVSKKQSKSLIQDPQLSLQRDQMKLMKQFFMPKMLQNYFELGIGFIWQIILLIFTFVVCTGLMFDIRAKHYTELQLHNLKMSECRHQFEINKCEDPVPHVREFCSEQEKCLLHDGNFVVKNINILTGLIVESLNSFSSQITNRALLVLAFISCLTIGIIKVYSSQQQIKVTLEQPQQSEPMWVSRNKLVAN